MPEQVQLMISDDGRGFDPEHVTSNHFGLIGMNERVNLLAGKLQVSSSPGAGTELEITVPLEANL
jgi:signal transduction histidine kinase